MCERLEEGEDMGAVEAETDESYWVLFREAGCACVRGRDRRRWNIWWSETLNLLILAPGNVTGF